MKVKLADLVKVVEKMSTEMRNKKNYTVDSNVEVEIVFPADVTNPINPDVIELHTAAKVMGYGGNYEDIELKAQLFSVSENRQPQIRKTTLILGEEEDAKSDTPF